MKSFVNTLTTAFVVFALVGGISCKNFTITEENQRCEGPEEKCNIRLNPLVIPVHYDLYIFPNITSGDFSGEVTIKLNIQSESVDHIRLHMKNLEITLTELRYGGNAIPVVGEEVPNLEYWVVRRTDQQLISGGRYELKFKFLGSLISNGLKGFYRSSYYDKVANASKYVVTTQFQSTHARKAFPCFDEPAFKSTFTLTIVKPGDLWVLSNMPLVEEQVDEPLKGLKTVKFQKSVPMVSYLLAFAIGDYAYKETMTKRGVPVRIYATKNQVENTGYVSNITAKIVDFFEDYFGVPYPLPKLDVIGIPDFGGGMENWGLITLRETGVLYKKGVASALNEQWILDLLGHEIAHMWFGNLMTLKWWNDLWLNEGFASYMEYKGVNAIHPDWEMESRFAAVDLAPVLGHDGQQSSHPIVQEVSHPDQISEIFDIIAYNKGASVIRMLENFMGRESFRKGVQQFLTKFSFKNAVTQDLWDELQSASEPSASYNISLVMDTWTRQMGYPVLSLFKDSDGKWKVNQERFLENRDVVGKNYESPFDYKWEIPVSVEWASSQGNKDSRMVWMRHDENETIQLAIEDDFEWLKLNKGQFGYYRVKYDEGMYKKLKINVPSNWANEEKCGILDDTFSLAFANYLDYNVALDFAQILRNETHSVPWDCSKKHLVKMGQLLRSVAPPDVYVLYRNYVLSIVSNIYENFTWTDVESDAHLNRLLKPMIFDLSCENGHKHCLEMSKQLFDKWIADPDNQKVPAGLRDIVYKWGMYQSDADKWNKLWKIYMDESDPQERIRHLRSLANSQDQNMLKTYLQLAKNESYVKRQDFFAVLRFISVNPVGNPIVWDFYRNEYQYLVDKFTVSHGGLGRIIAVITKIFSTQAQLTEVEDLFTRYPDGGAGTRSRKSALENIQNNMRWTQRNVPVIVEWLKSQSFPSLS